MSNKNVKCKNCGEEISKKAVICPKCGVKNKKPIYKRGWFIAAAVIVVICAIAGSGEESSAPVNSDGQVTENQQEIVYTEYELSQLFDDLENNALNAKNKYNKQYVKLTGELRNIDSSGDYISIDDGDAFRIVGIMCYLKNDEQKKQAASLKIGDTVTIKGKIKSVGEVMGYSLDIDNIE